MFGIGTGELLLLLLVALVVLGPERMPRLARDLGRALAEFRKTSDELREEFLNADKLAERMTQATVPGASAPAEPGPVEASSTGQAPLAETSGAAPAESTSVASVAEPTAAMSAAEPTAAVSAAEAARSSDAVVPDGPLVEPSLEPPAPAPDEAITDHGETAFDREAREARERLQSQEHRARAEAEGWEKPTDEAGNSSEKWA